MSCAKLGSYNFCSDRVNYLGNNFIYSSSDFGRVDVYTTIRSYLKAGSGTRCYNASDPNLNSTAWFANYIGSFVTLITLEDFKSFVSTSQMKAFLGDSTNLKLFSGTPVSETVTNYYITKLFELDPTFSLLKLPDFFFCSSEIPLSAYTSLSQADALVILERYQKVCNETGDTQVTVALASNIQTVTQQTLVKLGNGSSALSISQITSMSSSVMVSSLSTLGRVTTWSQIQVTTMVQILTNSGFKLNSSDSLQSLGTLVAGISSSDIQTISATVLLQATTSTTFVSNILMASTVNQQTFVQQIISLNSIPAMIVVNVPDALATAIPPAMLVFGQGTVDINVLNNKKWTPDQSSMFFELLAETAFDIEQLSPYVLQGFTCKGIQNMKKSTILQLIHACRPRNDRPKVMLKESQLTCMYNQLRGGISQNFSEYPSDMLLYFESQDIQKNNCRSYFSKLGDADFSVVSSVLNKAPKLFLEATTCLGINSKSLSKDNVEVLGNMVCTLDGSYIENSDPSILEKLKSCKDFSNSQVAAMETLLLSGNTQYGNTSTWNIQTLKDLGILPLYLTRNFWSQFTSATKRQFLKSFLSTLRKEKTERTKLKSLFRQISSLLVKRAASCTVGNITQVIISDESFPFGYDSKQFEFCLDVSILKDNLDSICQKVDDENFQAVILKKLNQAFPSGIPDQDVQMLGPVSRAASLDDISRWNISTIDTLGALMKPEDGVWITAQSKAIITKYLSTSENSLGITELNMINSYLCSLDVDTLKTITTKSIRNAKPLNVTSCSPEQKKVLYEISNTSFRTYRYSSDNFYDLVKAYIGGAPVADVKILSAQNISMDIDIFRSLQLEVIKALTVDDVQALMGNSLRDLKLFENDPIIQTWVNLQPQSDLNRLGLDLINNRTEAITASPSSSGNTPSSNQPLSTTTSGGTTGSTTGSTSGSTSGGTSGGTSGSSSDSTTSDGQGSSIFNGVKLMTPLPSLFLAALLIALQQVLQQPA
uniref:Mesothelin a n=2 Tax=Oryzias melastigma TaxID=30732 RepID=A0A3B3BZP7_ORYME